MLHIDIDPETRHQRIDGFGCCLGFQRAELIRRDLPPARRRQVLDLLFSTERGAGLSILRLAIGSSADGVYDHMRSIAPHDPGGPLAPARYEWDGADGGQVWAAREAMQYGIRRFYALPLSLVRADAMSWARQAEYTAAVEADPEATRWISVHTGHGYIEPARTPLPTTRATWMSEWEPDVLGNTWVPGWDSGHRADGIRLAEDIHDTLTTANVNGYLYWTGASIGGTRALVRLDAPGYTVAKRLWALAAYSRSVRPGAVRVAATSPDPQVKASAFVDPGGRTTANLLNTSTSPARVTLRRGPSSFDVYVTDEKHSLARVPVDGDLVLDPRSLTTVVSR